MNEQRQTDPRSEYMPLAQWLQEVLTPLPSSNPEPSQEQLSPHAGSHSTSPAPEEDFSNYHPHFYRQLPDFVMALLKKQPQATLHYAPLLYHLVGCPTCHGAYLELYAAMQAAMEPTEGHHHLDISQEMATLEPTAPRMVVQLCQAFIRQAEAVLRQARRDHADESGLARSLLQQAMRISTHVTQDNMRSQALRNLVRVATLANEVSEPAEQVPAVCSYSPMLISPMRHGSAVRGAGTTHATDTAPQEDAIHLHSGLLEGSITKREETLELHLHNLDEKLRGQHVSISVPLGSLIEPIRWRGGDPRTIRSVTPVDEHGLLNIPLGQTDLQLGNPEERNLLKATFLLLEVRPVD